VNGMKLKESILGIVFQVLLMALFVQFGLLSPSNDFFANVVASIIIVVVTTILSKIFGG